MKCGPVYMGSQILIPNSLKINCAILVMRAWKLGLTSYNFTQGSKS